MKKEAYRHNLPHFQQPGQAYFVFWILKNAVPPKAFANYTEKLEQLRNQIELHKQIKSDSRVIENLKNQYHSVRKRYIKIYDDLLAEVKNNIVDLSKQKNSEIILETLHFWDGKRLKNIACCIMPNHVHWVLEIFEKDGEGNPVYLQDILQSVKRFTAGKINTLEGRRGSLWQKENFDTTIREQAFV